MNFFLKKTAYIFFVLCMVTQSKAGLVGDPTGGLIEPYLDNKIKTTPYRLSTYLKSVQFISGNSGTQNYLWSQSSYLIPTTNSQVTSFFDINPQVNLTTNQFAINNIYSPTINSDYPAGYPFKINDIADTEIININNLLITPHLFTNFNNLLNPSETQTLSPIPANPLYPTIVFSRAKTKTSNYYTLYIASVNNLEACSADCTIAINEEALLTNLEELTGLEKLLYYCIDLQINPFGVNNQPQIAVRDIFFVGWAKGKKITINGTCGPISSPSTVYCVDLTANVDLPYKNPTQLNEKIAKITDNKITSIVTTYPYSLNPTQVQACTAASNGGDN